MRNMSLKAGLAAAIISVSSIAAFADTPPPVVVSEPHLGIVLNEVQSAVDGIKIEAQDRNLTAAQMAKLDQQANQIRRDAEQVAAKNNGKVPSADYHQLLARIEQLSVSSGAVQTPAVNDRS